MTTTEIICCLNELVKNTASAEGINPKITIIHDVKPDSFTWVIEETIKALEKSIICKSTIQSGTTRTDVEDKTCTTNKYFGESISTDSTDFDDIWDL